MWCCRRARHYLHLPAVGRWHLASGSARGAVEICMRLGASEASRSTRATLLASSWSVRAALLASASRWVLVRTIDGATEVHACLSLGVAETTEPTVALDIGRLARTPWGVSKGSWGVTGKQPMTIPLSLDPDMFSSVLPCHASRI